MALDATRLAAAIVSQLESQGFNTTSEYAYVSKMATAIATAVITEITTYALCSGADSNGDSHSLVKVV